MFSQTQISVAPLYCHQVLSNVVRERDSLPGAMKTDTSLTWSIHSSSPVSTPASNWQTPSFPPKPSSGITNSETLSLNFQNCVPSTAHAHCRVLYASVCLSVCLLYETMSPSRLRTQACSSSDPHCFMWWLEHKKL